jgi:signal transduction histidine kinase
VPAVSRPLPIPPLIDALRALGSGSRAADPADLDEALRFLAERLDLADLRLELLDADPLPAGVVSPAGGAMPPEPPTQLAGADGRTLARLWATGDREAVARAAQAVHVAIEAARAHLRADRAEEHLAALDAAVRGIAGLLSVERVLQLIVDRVRDLAGAEYAALGILGEDGRIEQFLTSGISAEGRRRIGSPPAGHGLLGLLIREGRSIRIPDINLDQRRHGFPAHHPEMRSFLGVPLTVRERSVGNLYLTNKRGGGEFSAADQELVERFAMHAGIAIENARLAEQVRQLLVIEERERIGADLHDGIIQRIYGVNLSLDEVPEMVATQPDEAARRVEQAIDALNATIGEIREFIFILRPPGEAGGGLVPALHALGAEVRLQAGLSVEVTADTDARLGADAIRELISVVREALSNTARHAAATRAEVSVRKADGHLELEVSDDGRGFDVAVARDARHRGLVNMRRRVERLGGTLDVTSRPGAGTRIIVVLPTEGRQARTEELAGHERAGHEA